MIHGEHPFVPPPSERDPARRLRGRLATPVTIFTAGSGRDRTGLTVSSLLVIEGEIPSIHAVVGPTTDLWYRIAETRRFVVHICSTSDRALSDVFAGIRPSPGGLFTDLDADDTDWGPTIGRLPHRAFCTLEEAAERGWTGTITAFVDRIEVGEMTDPLVHFRGRYRGLD